MVDRIAIGAMLTLLLGAHAFAATFASVSPRISSTTTQSTLSPLSGSSICSSVIADTTFG